MADERERRVRDVASCRHLRPAPHESWPGVQECRSDHRALLWLVDAHHDHGGSDPRAAAVVVARLARTSRCDWYVSFREHRRRFADVMGPDSASRVFRLEHVRDPDEIAAERALGRHGVHPSDHLVSLLSVRERAWRSLWRALYD